MSRARRMCFDKLLPRDLHRPQRVRSAGSGGRVRAIALKDKRWINGSKINITFLDGSANQQQMVKEFAPQWTEHANLEFVFVDGPPAHIRVTFDENDGAWSYVGTDNLTIPQHAATLNLGWQDEGVILHEFGHMIGLSHEHQNPDGGMQWNEAVVIQDLAGPPNFWSEEQTRHNVLGKYSADQLFGTGFDPESIMLYAFPADWTLNGVSTEENDELSDLDQAFVKSEEMYPGAAAPEERAVKLNLGETIAAEVSTAGEEDLYSFSVVDPGVYVLQTSGSTDVVMGLYGPDSETNLVSEDDDSGSGLNARIVADLSPGNYFAQVRHFSESRTGGYQIQVNR